ncbi:MAG TPA: tetratricopeptide repeat protein [Candidatus Omnitrophota bacterium]|nr:tetratricopeptide repeat protein [Candidatus Omnitrophota bacterium]
MSNKAKAFLFFIFSFVFFAVHLCFAGISAREYQRAIKYLEEKKYNEAIEIIQDSINEDPNQAMLYNLLGLIYLTQNESITSAIGSFEEAIRLDPNFADAYYNLATVYAGIGNRPERAAEYFRKTIEIDPNYMKAYFGLGWFSLTAEEDPKMAAEYFQKTINNYPNFAEAYYGLGLSYVQMKKAPMALESVSKIREMGREELAALLEMAIRGEGFPEGLREENSDLPPEKEIPLLQKSDEFEGKEVPLEKKGNLPLRQQASEIPVQNENTSTTNSNPFRLN